MTSEPGDEDILAHVLLPVAHEADAEATASALKPYGPTRVTALHVVERAVGPRTRHQSNSPKRWPQNRTPPCGRCFPTPTATPPMGGT